MSKLIVTNHVTLDGVMQGPARPDEDDRDGFSHGGWAVPNTDEVMGREMGAAMARGGQLLLGRRTYMNLHAAWAERDDNPYSEALNKSQKHVVSTTLQEPLPWINSTLISGDVAAAVTRLKHTLDHDTGVIGSGELIRSLSEYDLVDRYVLLVHPLVLGTGRRLFSDGATAAAFELSHSVTTTKGVIIATYDRVR